MNDDFLYKSRPPVRKTFADSLYRRLQTLDTNQQKGDITMKHTGKQGGVWKFALPILTLLTTFAFAFAFSESVRAMTLEFVREIAGFTVEERSESPLKTLDQNETTHTQAVVINPETDPGSVLPSTPKGEPTVYTVPTVPVTDMIKNPPFQFGLPTWVPDGYILDESAGIATSNNWVSLVWNNPNLSEIELLIEREYTGYNIPAGENSSEEILINGTPALLIQGFWDTDHQWDPKRGVSLDWQKDGHHYRLNYTERETAHHEIVPIKGNIEKIIEALVKIAESIS